MQSSSRIITTLGPTPNFLQAGCIYCGNVKVLTGVDELLNGADINAFFFVVAAVAGEGDKDC